MLNQGEFELDTGESTAFADTAPHPHNDQHGHYDHQLSEETTDTLSRTLTRLVPLVYGMLLGALSDSLLLGLAISLLVSLAFDLLMGDQSLVRNFSRQLARSDEH